jgi:hypothetical protein
MLLYKENEERRPRFSVDVGIISNLFIGKLGKASTCHTERRKNERVNKKAMVLHLFLLHVISNNEGGLGSILE